MPIEVGDFKIPNGYDYPVLEIKSKSPSDEGDFDVEVINNLSEKDCENLISQLQDRLKNTKSKYNDLVKLLKDIDEVFKDFMPGSYYTIGHRYPELSKQISNLLSNYE